jgi:hypothetical protein
LQIIKTRKIPRRQKSNETSESVFNSHESAISQSAIEHRAISFDVLYFHFPNSLLSAALSVSIQKNSKEAQRMINGM